jgi:hypothetical protein
MQFEGPPILHNLTGWRANPTKSAAQPAER